MMQHPMIDQMIADQRAEEMRRRGDTARIARSVTPAHSIREVRRWARAKHALPQFHRRLLPTIHLRRARPAVAHHRTPA
jgi:hypothetical protein